ncbi:glycosyltransferase [Microbulbifer sp. SH-1]|uniref:glycosyltransferase family 4 protein n=1 Tax=Microbulbifer sp. SH-1 TaxID=2681547 RepID=UPI001408513F|nr:glycosyltransferase family 1 protein [Microbulbifer sp. SH-1]QIL89348.1 glycosyltransferase [Microbulbifer sp. SH-1]
MARIAVDARPLSIPTTGIGRYTHAIMRRLLDSEHHWYLYSHQPLLHEFEGLPNVTVRCGSMQHAGLGSLYAQVVFPLWVGKDQVDLFWSPRHHLPLCLGKSLPKLVTIHDLVWQRFPQTMSRLGRQIERVLMPPSLKFADAVIAVSDSTANEVRNSFPGTAGKIRTIYEAPFLEAAEGPRCDGNYFLFVGTIEPRKNLPALLRAYRIYQSRLTRPLPLKICGGKGWGLPELESLIAQEGLGDCVELLGYIHDDQLPALYRNARALLMPSLYEGFGLPIVEAFSQGTPVMTSNRGAMKEVAGDAGLLVDPECAEDMAAALVELTSNSALVEEFQQRAQTRAKLFSWDHAGEQTLSLIESLLASKR